MDLANLNSVAALEQHLDWENSGWPPFELYAPVFQAARNARHYGAHIPRSAMRRAMQEGAARFFGPEAARFGLNIPLPPAEQAARENDQQDSHCNAMPPEMLPLLVDLQRLRDANLAAMAERALLETGGPVVVITGNGHARRDRGYPVYLKQAAPQVEQRSLGQMEAGQISGVFDVLLTSPGVDRPDPCLAFQQSQ